MDEKDLDAEWRADRLAHRLNTVRRQRPVKLRGEYELDPRIAAWGQALVAGTAGNLVIIGLVGRTKSWNVWEVLERSAAAGWPGSFDFATTAAWHDAITPPVDKERIRAMRSVGLLILDDLGSSRIQDWERECLLGVVDERWQHGLPIVITTNMQKLSAPLGDRLASRLKDGATLVILDGDDRRADR